MHPFIAGQPVPDHEAIAPEAARYSRLVRSFRIVSAGRGPQFGPALGLGAALAIAAALVAFHGAGTQFDADTSSSPVQAGSVTLVGLTPERFERVTYEPGASRSWSPGPQIVGVRVLSGRLTVYGGDGEPRVYVTGEGYAAGWAAYRTVNETDQRVETLVTNHVGCRGPALDETAFGEEEDRGRCYLLFAGSQRTPQGGLADLVGAFTSEETARQAFRHMRLDQSSVSSWAQLAVVDGHHGIRALSWYGIGATPVRTPVTFPRPKAVLHTQPKGGVMQVATRESPSPAGPQPEPTARRRLKRGIAVWLVGLVAVAVITIGVMSDDGRTRSVGPKSVTVDASGPANDPVVPFSVDTSAVADGSSFDR